ncbi:fibronectin type III domain-containing protein [Paenibacillus koleovorans]|uniref:fibronectin type III domain-containing protein n=1 Tax=Paenibacillus koleovorans TaxID=121608 RepID=UPI000FDC2A8C|nr:fibronectin type III domain-containing protein [Paenibacillus koleovorans]
MQFRMKNVLMFILVICWILNFLPNLAIGQIVPELKSVQLDEENMNHLNFIKYSTGSKDIENIEISESLGFVEGKKIVRELPELRNQTSKQFLLEDGSFVAYISSEPIHYEDEDGNYQEVKTKLVDEEFIEAVRNVKISREAAKHLPKVIDRTIIAKEKNNLSEGYFRTLQTNYHSLLPKQYSDGYSISRGNDTLTFIPLTANNSLGVMNAVYDNQIKYYEVWKSTDVLLEANTRGIKESIILRDDTAPKLFSFEVEGNIMDDFSAGQLQISPAFVEDSNGTIRLVKQSLRKESNRTYLDLIINTEGLSYPMVLDPAVFYNTVNRGSIKNKYYIMDEYQNSPSSSEIDTFSEYYVEYTLDNYQDSIYIRKSFVKYDTSSIPADAVISTALLTHTDYINWRTNTTTNPFTLGLYSYDFGPTLDPSDYSANAPLVASLSVNTGINYGYGYTTFQLPATAINKAGITSWRVEAINISSNSFATWDDGGPYAAPSLYVGYTTDTTAPSVPSGVVITNRTATSISIAWNPSTDNVGVYSYIINGCGNPKDVSGSITSYTCTGLTQNTSYTFTVKAKDIAGNESAFSSGATTQTLADTIAPTKPSLTYEAYYESNPYFILLYAFNSYDEVGVTSTEYFKDGQLTWTTPGQDPFFTLLPNTMYHFTARTKDAAGNVSPMSDALSVIIDSLPPTAPSTPYILTRNGASATISWLPSSDNVGVSTYYIYDKSNQIGSSAVPTFTYSNFQMNRLYQITVRAKDEAGNLSVPSKTLLIYSGNKQFKYDSKGRLDYIQFSSGEKLKYTYDNNGNVLQQVVQP